MKKMLSGLRHKRVFSRGKAPAQPRAGTVQERGPRETRPPAAAAAAAAAADDDDDNDGASPGGGMMTVLQVEEFFRTTIKRLTSPDEREDIKSKVRPAFQE